jgi:molybdopterin-containing oxidoreductase family membrane subunit
MIGIYSFYLQTTEGHLVTGISKEVPWGIYIAAFAFFVGASAGATIIGFLIHAFGRNDYKALGVRSIIIGILSLTAAILFIIVDVGIPLRMFKVPWILNNSSSMFFISSMSYYLFMILLLAELYFAVKVLRNKASKKEKQISKWLAIIAVPYALLVVHMVTGFIFSVIKTREYWNTPLLPMHFIIAALATGTAIIILATIFSSNLETRTKKLISSHTLNHLGLLLAIFIGITLLFDISDVLVMKYTDRPDGVEAWRILTEQHTLLFMINWVFLVGAMLIVSFKKGRTAKWLGLASLMVIIAVAVYRFNLVIVPQKVALLPDLGEIHYSPTLTEISITTGIMSFIVLFYFVALKLKPIKQAIDEELKEKNSQVI